MKKRMPNFKDLSVDESFFLVNLLRVLMREEASEGGGPVVGAGLRDFPDRILNRADEERKREAARSLIERRILVLQYGKQYRREGYTGPTKKKSEIWYSFHPDLFPFNDEDEFKRRVDQVVDAIRPRLLGISISAGLEDFVTCAVRWAARSLDW